MLSKIVIATAATTAPVVALEDSANGGQSANDDFFFGSEGGRDFTFLQDLLDRTNEDGERDANLDNALARLFFSKLYIEQLGLLCGSPPEITKCDWKANSAVSNVPANVLNVAAPDYSAGYWVTFLPPNNAPILKLTFPKWAEFTSLTMYDTLALDIPNAGLNSMDADAAIANACLEKTHCHDEDVCKPLLERIKSTVPADSRITANLGKDHCPDGGVTVNMMEGLSGIKRNSLYIVIFRVYRPATGENSLITPERDLPDVAFVRFRVEPDGTVKTQRPTHLKFLPQAGTDVAMANGTILGDQFNTAISSLLVTPGADEMNTRELTIPSNPLGMYINPNAAYLNTYFAEGTSCMTYTATVPPQEMQRAFYGFMGTDQVTTRTVDSLQFEQLGGWGANYMLYACRTKTEAISIGYSPEGVSDVNGNPLQEGDAGFENGYHHKLMLFTSEKTPTNEIPWYILRYIVYQGKNNGLTTAQQTSAQAARTCVLEYPNDCGNGQGIEGLPNPGTIKYYAFAEDGTASWAKYSDGTEPAGDVPGEWPHSPSVDPIPGDGPQEPAPAPEEPAPDAEN